MNPFLFLVSGQNGNQGFITYLLISEASNVTVARELALEALEKNETIYFVKSIALHQTNVDSVFQLDSLN